ncbi:MAG: hypothetical protein J6C79_04240 [Clostridia bacterium]|nr:hypothetical protein [Clostridia bacterium]
MKKARITMISLAAIAACACVSMGAKAIDVNAATTPTYATFKMQEGASVRVGNVKDENDVVIDSGLRFCAEISADEYNALIGVGAKFGMIIAASDQLGDVELNEKNVFEDPLVYYDGQENADTSKIMVTNVRAEYADVDNDGAKEICGALTNIKESNLTRPFVGRAYVAIPSKTETVETEDGTTETVVTEYEYHFAPYYANDGYTADDVQNNTRSVYYVAQKAVEAGDSRSDELKEDYINKLSNKNYKYIINYHYIHKDGSETCVENKNSALLNAKITLEEGKDYSATMEYGGSEYTLSSVANEGLHREGLVYATFLQTFDIYYNEKTPDTDANVQQVLEDMLTSANASTTYFGGELQYVSGDLVSTDQPDGIGAIFGGSGQSNVNLNNTFVTELKNSGAKYLRVKTIYSTPTSGWSVTECVTVSGFSSGTEYHFVSDVDAHDGEVEIGQLLTTEGKTYLAPGSDGYIYINLTTLGTSGVTFSSARNLHWTVVGRDWVLAGFTALAALPENTDGLIVLE